MTAIFPIAQLTVVDPKVHVAISALRLISARTGVDRERDSSSLRWVVHVDDVANDVIEFFLRVDPSTERKVVFSQLQRIARGHLDVRLPTVKAAMLEIHAMIHAVITKTRRITSITPQLP